MDEPKAVGAASIAAIRAIPAAVAALLAGGRADAERIADLIGGAARVFLVGTGSSYHAASFGEFLLRAVGLDAWAVPAFEFVNYPRPLQATDAVIVISHRGNKQFSVASLARARTAGVPGILVTGRDTRYAGQDATLMVTTVEQERSSMHTVSLVGAAVVLALAAVATGQRRGAPAAGALAEGLARLPEALAVALEADAPVATIARAAVERGGRFFFVGAGPNAATASEAALKAREGAYVTGQGLAIEEFIHGPLIGVEADDLVTLISPPGPSRARAGELLAAVGEIGAATWLIGEAGRAGATYATTIPELPEPLTPLIALVALDLFAYHLAMARGTDPDGFRLEQERYLLATKLVPL